MVGSLLLQNTDFTDCARATAGDTGRARAEPGWDTVFGHTPGPQCD